MKIRKVRRYRRARYPRGTWRRRQKDPVSQTAKGGLTSLLLMALTDACDVPGLGATGPPPVMPEMVTEHEARQIINQVFVDNGVTLQEDFPLVFRWAQDSIVFDVDGYNEELEVGYEYLNPDYSDHQYFSQEAVTALNEARDGDGPHIEIVEPGDYYAMPKSEAEIEAQIRAFIEKLKGMGII